MMHARQLMMAASALLAGMPLAGCDKADPTQGAAADARDVAMVERMNREPFRPIVPGAIGPTEVARYGLDRPGCRFRKGGVGDPLFIATGDVGFMRVGDAVQRYAAKGESAVLPGKARSTYVGLASWIDLARLPDSGTGGNQERWPARLIIHDAQERVAYTADGVVTCGS